MREASVARKIGALRESVIAALQSLLDRGRRERNNDLAIDTQYLEAQLRRVSGEIGEQRTILDRAFCELGERPEMILSELADMVTTGIVSGASRSTTSMELAEWTYDIVQRHVDGSLAKTRDTVRDAIETLQKVAREMARSDAPSHQDAEILLRDAPRYEIKVTQAGIALTRWKWLGRWMVRVLVMSSLRQSLNSPLKDELHHYGRALSQWGEQMTRKMQALMNSYTDAYRAQLNRIHGTSTNAVAAPEMESDLALLLQRGMTATKDAEQERA